MLKTRSIVTQGALRYKTRDHIMKDITKSDLIAITALERPLFDIYDGVDVSYIEYYEKKEEGVYIRTNVMQSSRYRVTQGDDFFVSEIAYRIKEIVTNHSSYIVVMQKGETELKDYYGIRP